MIHPRYRLAAAAYAAVGLLVLIVTVFLPATGAFSPQPLPIGGGPTSEAQVLEVLTAETQETQAGVVIRQRLRVLLDDGREVEVEHAFVEGGAQSIEVAAGDAVLVGRLGEGADETYVIRDRGRRVPLWALSLGFAMLVVVVGGRHGALSLAGLAISVLVIMRFVVPGILAGLDPVTLAVIGAFVIMSATLLVSHGANLKTAVALGGTTLTLIATALLAAFAVGLTRLSGTGADDAAILHQLAGGAIDMRGLLLGGIIIGALGVLDDVTITQASTVIELRAANPALTARDLFLRGMNVGRDHIAATTNTLVLAYAGAALPLLVILAAQPVPFGVIISIDALATEVVRTLAGSAGIVLAVPVTTALAAVLMGRPPVETAFEG